MPGKEIVIDFGAPSEEPEERVMSFGKYKGERLGDLPNRYLIWCLENFDDDLEKQSLIEDMQRVLDGRYDYIEDEYRK
jgi:hypothetical protein